MEPHSDTDSLRLAPLSVVASPTPGLSIYICGGFMLPITIAKWFMLVKMVILLTAV